MDKFAENINNICTACIPYVWILAVVALLIVGVMFIIPSDGIHQKAIKALPFILIGCILALGAVYIGKWLTGLIVF